MCWILILVPSSCVLLPLGLFPTAPRSLVKLTACVVSWCAFTVRISRFGIVNFQLKSFGQRMVSSGEGWAELCAIQQNTQNSRVKLRHRSRQKIQQQRYCHASAIRGRRLCARALHRLQGFAKGQARLAPLGGVEGPVLLAFLPLRGSLLQHALFPGLVLLRPCDLGFVHEIRNHVRAGADLEEWVAREKIMASASSFDCSPSHR